MLKVIQNNPYRFLGVYSNASIAERLANSRKLNAFLKVNKEVSFPLDLTSIMPSLKRTVEGMNMANSSINLPKDQLKNALFWFINVTSIDKMALEYLQNGNIAKAADLFGKRANFSSLINRGVLAFITGDNGDAIRHITSVIHEDEFRDSFVETICGSNYQIEETEVAQLFIDTLLEEIPVGQLKDLFEQYGTSSEDDDILREKYIGEPIAAINNAIAQAKNVKNDDAVAQYQAGVNLMNSTKADLQAIHSILGKNDMQYQMIADNLAKQILQCGINYFNNSDDDDDVQIEKAYKLQNYALLIAAGKLTRDRCKENVDILIKRKQELPPKEVGYYDKLIKAALITYMGQSETISNAINLIKKTIPYLMSIKEVLGNSNTYYLRTSTQVVNAALHNVIEEFNGKMNDKYLEANLTFDRERTLNSLKEMFKHAWEAISYMDKLDMEYEYRNDRYKNNREALKSHVTGLININSSVSLDMRGETKFFNDCRTVSDYNKYNSIFPNGKYASLVKDRIEKCEFEACKTTQDCQKFQNKYPNTKYPILEKWEDCYFNQCKTIDNYNGYLRSYPNGKYVWKAKLQIDKLSYNACCSIYDYQSYISKFPKGSYVDSARDKIDSMSYQACTTVPHYKKYLSNFPNGKYVNHAKTFIADEEMWSQCVASDTKQMYKDYLAKFPNGNHRAEAEQKANACYIATMVYGDYNHPQVIALRRFRDQTLYKSEIGKAFIRLYYRYSPRLVEKMQEKKAINTIIRTLLDKFIKLYENGSK